MAFAPTGRVVCIGAANIDRKLTPKGPLRMGTSNPARQHESFGGVARNIAENLAHFGVKVALVTAVGDDAPGDYMLAHAGMMGVDVESALVLEDTATGTYTAVLDEHGDMALALADMDIYDKLVPEQVLPLGGPVALAIADLNLPRATVAALLKSAAPLVIVAVSEPKIDRLPRNLAGLRLLILNHGELQARLGRSIDGDRALLAACREVQAQGAQDLVVTCGDAGAWFTTPNGIAHVSAVPVEAVDVTGAGDAFAAAVCWSLLASGDDLGLACERGALLAAATISTPFTVIPAPVGAHAALVSNLEEEKE